MDVVGINNKLWWICKHLDCVSRSGMALIQSSRESSGLIFFVSNGFWTRSEWKYQQNLLLTVQSCWHDWPLLTQFKEVSVGLRRAFLFCDSAILQPWNQPVGENYPLQWQCKWYERKLCLIFCFWKELSCTGLEPVISDFKHISLTTMKIIPRHHLGKHNLMGICLKALQGAICNVFMHK